MLSRHNKHACDDMANTLDYVEGQKPDQHGIAFAIEGINCLDVVSLGVWSKNKRY
jgi:hypothetical protein